MLRQSVMRPQLEEEAGVHALDMQEQGVLTFVFDDGKHWEVTGERKGVLRRTCPTYSMLFKL